MRVINVKNVDNVPSLGPQPGTLAVLTVVNFPVREVFPRRTVWMSRMVYPGSEINTGGER